MLVRAGVKREKTVDMEERMRSFEDRLSKITKVTEESEEGRKWQGGQKTAGTY